MRKVAAIIPLYRVKGRPTVSLNKKQQKQLDLEQKKLSQLQQQLSGARKQMDDPQEVARLEQELAATQARIDRLKAQS